MKHPCWRRIVVRAARCGGCLALAALLLSLAPGAHALAAPGDGSVSVRVHLPQTVMVRYPTQIAVAAEGAGHVGVHVGGEAGHVQVSLRRHGGTGDPTMLRTPSLTAAPGASASRILRIGSGVLDTGRGAVDAVRGAPGEARGTILLLVTETL